jgi:competence protein ComEA
MLFKILRSIKRNYFSLTRRELRGNLILLFVLMIQLSYLIINRNFKPEPIPSRITYVELPLENVAKNNAAPKQVTKQYNNHRTIRVTKSFDPNTTSIENWVTMGLDQKIAQRIVKYVSRGGNFRKAEDLLKIYGMKENDYMQLAPYVQIESLKPGYKEKTTKQPNNPSKRIVIELNGATAEELESLPQIGHKRAQRIIKYRELLGGFYRNEQLTEVYSIDSSVYVLIKDKIRTDTSIVHKILINSIVDNSIYHPYLSRKHLNRIIAYRNSHGLFTDKASVCRAALLNDKLCGKIAPYLKLE